MKGRGEYGRGRARPVSGLFLVSPCPVNVNTGKCGNGLLLPSTPSAHHQQGLRAQNPRSGWAIDHGHGGGGWWEGEGGGIMARFDT